MNLEREDVHVPNVSGRMLFLIAVRNHWPEFWWSLRKLCLLGDMRRPTPEQFAEELLSWARDHHAEKDAWLLHDVLRPTIQQWTDDPDSPNSKLSPGHLWFTYTPNLAIPEFAPVFTDAQIGVRLSPEELKSGSFPDVHQDQLAELHASTRIETWDEFKARMQAQFDAQVKEYGKMWRSLFPTARPAMEKHAKWTVLHMKGLTPIDIAQLPDEGVELSDPEDAIRNAVKEFRKAIGITA